MPPGGLPGDSYSGPESREPDVPDEEGTRSPLRSPLGLTPHPAHHLHSGFATAFVLNYPRPPPRGPETTRTAQRDSELGLLLISDS